MIYYNETDLSVEKDLEYYNMIHEYVKSKRFKYEIDISNEARMHIWKMEHNKEKILPYKSAEDAMKRWIATVHAIGITKEDKKIKVYAPYGLSAIFNKTIRPIKHKDNSKELYNKKVDSWKKRFNNLDIIKW